MRIVSTVLLIALAAACGPVAVGPVLVRGTVVDESRRPVAGARVIVEAMDDSEEVAVGETVEPVFEAETTSGPDGTFEIRVVPTAELRSLAAVNGGFVNFRLIALLGPGRTAVWAFPRELRGDLWAGAVPVVALEPLGEGGS